jgi:hypothetical protein
LSLPSLLRLRWHLLVRELSGAPPEPEPEVFKTHGLSDDPDPVGSTTPPSPKTRVREVPRPSGSGPAKAPTGSLAPKPL